MPEVKMPDGTTVIMPDNPTPEQLAKLRELQSPKQDFTKVLQEGSGVKYPSKPLTKSERGYRMARQFVAPVVEGGAMLGGAAIGAGLGVLTTPTLISNPVTGGVAGAGLGYGIGKQIMKAGDYNLGGYTPPPFKEQLLDAGKDIVEGAAMEMAGPYINKGVGYVAGGLKDAGVMVGKALGGATGQLAERRAAKIAQEAAAGSKIGSVADFLAAIRNRGAGQTGAQATAKLESPAFQALLERAGLRDPGAVAQIEALQAKESGDALRSLAPWENQTQGRQATDILQELLNKRTGPIREHAFEMSNMGQLVADLERRSAELGAEATAKVARVRHLMDLGKKAEAGAQLDLIMQGMPTAASKYTYKGELAGMADRWASKAANESLGLGADARTMQAGAQALRSEGIAPLETAPIIKNIKTNLSNPRFAGNDLIEGAINGLSEDLAKWTNKDGVIPAEALDAIRKNSVDAVIARLRPGVDATTQRKLAAKVLSEIKPVIDDAIISSGGKDYGTYLAEHSAGMQDISKTKLLGEALRQWETNPQAFRDLVRGNAPETVEGLLGPGKYDISSALSPRETGILNSEALKIDTNETVKRQAGMGQQALADIMDRNTWRARIPFMIDRKVTVANALLSQLEGKQSAKVMAQLADAANNPAKLEALLNRVPPSARGAILNILKSGNMRQSVNQVAPAVMAGANSGIADDGRQ